MTKLWQFISTKYPWRVIFASFFILIGLGWYASGLFSSLSSSDEGFFAENTESSKTRETITHRFGTDQSKQIILFERADVTLGLVTDSTYQNEMNRLLEPLRPKVESITTYETTHSEALMSRDKTKTYAVVVMDGDSNKVYDTLNHFVTSADGRTLKMSLGGPAASQQQMTRTVEKDLARTEIVTLPILLILLVLFFRSGVAALVPIGMSLVTIIGAFALSRWLSEFIPIDTYAVNVITILGIGLSIDYALLSVNRYREELTKGSVDRAVRTVIATSGRTIFFSGITVMACLLALLVFPMEFLHSIAIGGASSVAIAMLFTVSVLPAILRVIGHRIDNWHLPGRDKGHSVSKTWQRLAKATTTYPKATLLAGLLIVALAIIPIAKLKLIGAMNHNWLARDTSSQYVGDVLDRDFTSTSAQLTGLLELPANLTENERYSLSCELTEKLQAIEGVSSVLSPTPISTSMNCGQFMQARENNLLPAAVTKLSDDMMRDRAILASITLDSEPQTAKTDQTLQKIREITMSKGALGVTGQPAQEFDTFRAYESSIPLALGIIAISMIILLALLLRSIVLPLQSIIVNAISLCISLAAIIGVFQLGWFSEFTGWRTTDGIVMTAPVLVMSIAFGLAMDYSVFLYSRMREIYDTTHSPIKAIRNGIIHTGPIITAAALALFVVVVAFAFSSIMFIQLIGLGLGVAVLVDAFFVRMILVPSLMTLMGKASWYGPKWLNRWSIKHE